MAEFSSSPNSRQQNSRQLNQLAVGNVIRINPDVSRRFWEDAKVWDEHGAAVQFQKRFGFFHCPEAAIPTWWTQLPVARRRCWWVGPEDQPPIVSEAKAPSLIRQSLRYRSSLILRVPKFSGNLKLRTFMIGTMIPSAAAPTAMSPVDGLEAQQVLSNHSTTNYFCGRSYLHRPRRHGSWSNSEWPTCSAGSAEHRITLVAFARQSNNAKADAVGFVRRAVSLRRGPHFLHRRIRIGFAVSLPGCAHFLWRF